MLRVIELSDREKKHNERVERTKIGCAFKGRVVRNLRDHSPFSHSRAGVIYTIESLRQIRKRNGVGRPTKGVKPPLDWTGILAISASKIFGKLTGGSKIA